VNDGENLDSVQEKRGAPRGAPVYSSRRPRAPRRTLWEPLPYGVKSAIHATQVAEHCSKSVNIIFN
jgi:hypothetical protein